MHRWYSILLVGLALLSDRARAQAAPWISESTPFTSGQNGYATYRIPAIVRSPQGTLLAFCEGRKTSSADAGDIDIVLRRSTNNGASWLPMTSVQEEGGTASITVGNPAPVVDELTGQIHLLFCRNNDRVFHTVSWDDGLTWSARHEITAAVKLESWGWFATGPGHGIQLQRGAQAGRLVVPCDHRIGVDGVDAGTFGSQVVYSDDHGLTWKLGGWQDTVNNVAPNENLAVELVAPSSDGGSRLYFNFREHGSATGNRAQGWSANGGTTYAGPLTNPTSFVCPTVQASLLRLRATDEGAPGNRILFSCPNHASSRVNLSVWSSTNEAVSWSAPKPIYAGPSAYSDLVRDRQGQVGLLCEKGAASPYETISFFRFNEAWLDTPAPPAPPEEAPVPAFWTLEEKVPGQACVTNAGAIRDVHPAGYANHLTAQVSFVYVAGPSQFGSGAALHFDGTGGLQVSDTASSNHFDFGSNTSFTVEVVFRVPTNYASVGSLVAKDYGSTLPSWWLRVESGRIRFLVSDNSVESYLSTTVLVNDGQWHHVAAVRDANQPAAKMLRLWLDGILNTNRSDATVGTLANSQPINIGRFGAAATRNLTGDIDMVRISPEALGPGGFLAKYTQFDADADGIPDAFERPLTESLPILGPGDADADGWVDLLEFALGSSPQDSRSIPRLEVIPAADSVRLATRQRGLPAWLELQLELSTDLKHWEASLGTLDLTPLEEDLFWRSQRVPIDTTHSGQFFRYRLIRRRRSPFRSGTKPYGALGPRG